MKIIDNNFKQVEFLNQQFLNDVIVKIRKLLVELEIKEEFIKEVLDDSDNILIQITDGSKYSIITPGNNVRTMNFPNSGAFKTNMVIDADENSLNIIPGICMRPKYNNSQLVHELFHAISSKQKMPFDENGITYTKTGTKIEYYDKKLNDSNEYTNISSDFLNEGMTDYFTSLIIGNKDDIHYYFAATVADILNKNSNSLANAYFSRNIGDLLSFCEEFNKSQDVIDYNELVSLDTINIPIDMSVKILKGAISYCLATQEEKDMQENISYIVSKLEYLDKNDSLDSGSWKDLIDLNEYIKSPEL